MTALAKGVMIALWLIEREVEKEGFFGEVGDRGILLENILKWRFYQREN